MAFWIRSSALSKIDNFAIAATSVRPPETLAAVRSYCKAVTWCQIGSVLRWLANLPAGTPILARTRRCGPRAPLSRDAGREVKERRVRRAVEGSFRSNSGQI